MRRLNTVGSLSEPRIDDITDAKLEQTELGHLVEDEDREMETFIQTCSN